MIVISQDVDQKQALELSLSERRLLLTASFRLFIRHLSRNLPVLREDIGRLSKYGDKHTGRTA